MTTHPSYQTPLTRFTGILTRGMALFAILLAFVAQAAWADAPVLQLVSSSSTMVGRPVDATITAASGTPDTVKFSGLPAGVTGRWSASDGKVLFTGTPSKADTFRVIATPYADGCKGPSLTFWLTISPLPELGTGLFSGLIQHNEIGCSPLGGRICLQVTPWGQFTGRLLLGGKSVRLKGRFVGCDPDMMEAGIAVETIGKTITLWLQLTLNTATGEIHGTLGAPSAASENLIPIHLLRAGCPVALFGKTFAATILLPNSLMGNATYPQGHGYLTGNINACGCATVIARFSDNTVATCYAPIMPDGAMPLYYPLYKGTGSVLGVPQWVANGGGFNLDGSLIWIKNSQPGTTRSYKAGFPAHTLTVAGETIVPQLADMPNLLGTVPLPFGQNDNAIASFAGGAMSTDVQLPFYLSALNVALSHSPKLLKIQCIGSNQVYSGTMTTEGITSSFYGVILRRLSEGFGFHLRALNSKAPILSGEVRLYSAPAP